MDDRPGRAAILSPEAREAGVYETAGGTRGAAAERVKPHIRRLVQFLGIAIVVALWSTYLWRTWGQLSASEWRLAPVTAAFALLCWLIYFLALGVGWALLARWLGGGLPLATGVRIWAWSMPARYVPGNVWHVAGRVYLGGRAGGRRDALLAASALEQPLTLLGAMLLGVPAFVAEGYPGRLIGGAALAVGGLVAVHPRVLPALLRLGGRFVGKEVVVAALSYQQTAIAVAWYLLASGVGGVAFWSSVAAICSTTPAELPRLAGVWGLAYVVGYLSFITPAGLGVREAAIVALLGPAIPAPVGVAAGLLARAGSALAEPLAILVIAASGLGWRLVVRAGGGHIQPRPSTRMSE